MQQHEGESATGSSVEGEPAEEAVDEAGPDGAAEPVTADDEPADDGVDVSVPIGDPRLDRVIAELAALSAGIASTNDRATARESVIERLFDENDRLRAGERTMILRPVAVDLQRLRNDLLRQAESLPAEMSAEQMASLLQSFAFSAEQALERCGVTVIRPDHRTPFDPKRHRAAASVAADSPELDAVVADVVADGYLDTATDRVITTATVRVYRWTPPDPTIITQPDHSSADAEAPLV